MLRQFFREAVSGVSRYAIATSTCATPPRWKGMTPGRLTSPSTVTNTSAAGTTTWSRGCRGTSPCRPSPSQSAAASISMRSPSAGLPKTAPSTTTAEPEPKLDSTRTKALSRSVTSIPSSKVTAIEVYSPFTSGWRTVSRRDPVADRSRGVPPRVDPSCLAGKRVIDTRGIWRDTAGKVYPLRLLTPPLRRRLRPDRYRSGTSTRLSDRRRKMPSSTR